MMRTLLPVAALLTSTFLLLSGGGVQWVLLPIRAQLEGFSTDAIGLMGTGWAIGFSGGCLIVPRIVRRVGHVRALSGLLALVAIAILANAMYINPVFWFALRAVAGLCFSGAYMIIESWLNERVTNETRGAVFSFYLIVTQVGIIAGQYVIVFAPPDGLYAFMAAAMLFASAILPIALSTAPMPSPIAETRLNVAKLYRNSPASVVGVLLAGMLAGAWQNFAPVYATMNGLATVFISTILALSMVGSALSQYPMGRISDHVDRRFVMVAVGIGGAITCFYAAGYQVDAADPGIEFFVLMALVGAFVYPIYAVLVAHANDYARTDEYVEVSSGLLIVYGVGTMIGPLATARATVMVWRQRHVLHHGGRQSRARGLCRLAPGGAAARQGRRGRRIPAARPAQTPQTYALSPASEAETSNPVHDREPV